MFFTFWNKCFFCVWLVFSIKFLVKPCMDLPGAWISGVRIWKVSLSLNVLTRTVLIVCFAGRHSVGLNQSSGGRPEWPASHRRGGPWRLCRGTRLVGQVCKLTLTYNVLQILKLCFVIYFGALTKLLKNLLVRATMCPVAQLDES